VAHTCNHSYSGGRDQEDCSLRSAQAKLTPIQKKIKRVGEVAQVVECLLESMRTSPKKKAFSASSGHSFYNLCFKTAINSIVSCYSCLRAFETQRTNTRHGNIIFIHCTDGVVKSPVSYDFIQSPGVRATGPPNYG
jgi:hypothetical protein